MWPRLVVILAPCRDDHPGLGERREPVLVEALVAEFAVKRLDIGILRRLARLNQFQGDAVGVGPLVERAAREFRPLVRA